LFKPALDAGFFAVEGLAFLCDAEAPADFVEDPRLPFD
jgi:hypothetical protein